jgi:hypothetical protein
VGLDPVAQCGVVEQLANLGHPLLGEGAVVLTAVRPEQ